ncbi:MAG: hypothetical protein RMM98_11305 [Acidobacteriota bacterium]|nr:hypothetical protein [Acidobacteriota bacterium]
MGQGTRKAELRQRRHRQKKRRLQRQRQFMNLLSQAKSREERVRLAQEFKAAGRATPAADAAP